MDENEKIIIKVSMYIKSKIKNKDIKGNRGFVTNPVGLVSQESRYYFNNGKFLGFMSFQHPLINLWLIFSLFSIAVLSVLLYII